MIQRILSHTILIYAVLLMMPLHVIFAVESNDNDLTCLFPAFDTNAQKYGYINEQGEWRIPPRYDTAHEFYEDVAVTVVGDNFGVIDENGNWLCQPIKVGLAPRMSDGLIAAFLNHKIGFINKYGEWVIASKYDNTFGFHEGFAAVQSGDQWGYIDKTGTWKILPKYDMVTDFNEGLASVTLNGKDGFINYDDEYIIPPKYKIADSFYYGKAAVCTDDGWGIIDKKGAWIIWPQPTISEIRLSKNLEPSGFCVEINNKYGFMDFNGNWLIPLMFDNWIEFSEGLAGTSYGLRYGKLAGGYINTSGQWVIMPKYSIPMPFKNGVARVMERTNDIDRVYDGYIDRDGKWVYRWCW